MSNNRMYLVNTHTKQRLLLAKYYPSTGWYVFPTTIRERMDALFDAEVHEHVMWGDTNWTIMYEANSDGSNGPACQAEWDK